jgi:hypothetical protein
MLDLELKAHIDCGKKCEIPEGVILTEIFEKPRHRWDDIVICPHEGCNRMFLVLAKNIKVEKK